MIGKYYHPPQEYTSESINNRSNNISSLRMKLALKQQKKQFRKRIFGQHYNYSFVSLNKEKKFLKAEEKNTEIQRANRILLEKIQKISKRSVPASIGKRNYTQESDILSRQQVLKNFVRKDSANLKISLRSHQNLIKPSICESRSTQNSSQKMVFFRGKKQIEGKCYFITIFVEASKYNILIEQGKSQQKISMEIEGYQTILREYLQGNHLNIFNFLQVDERGIIQISGIQKHLIDIIEHEQLQLPNPETSFKQEY